MPIDVSYNARFSQFVQFAEQRMQAGKADHAMDFQNATQAAQARLDP